MRKYPNGSWVYVPSNMLPNPDGMDFALTRTKVMEQREEGRSVRVDLQDVDGNDIWVSARRLHGDGIGIAIIRIGDFVTEVHNLDPLAKSLLHFLRLMMKPEEVDLYEVRTVTELEAVWRRVEPKTSHVVLVGHGAPDSIRLLDRANPIGGAEFGKLLSAAVPKGKAKVFISLSCETGNALFAKPFSQTRVCAELLAPYESVHSAAASQFAQNFFASHLLNGKGIVAARRAASATLGPGATFRLWRDGNWLKG